ncbi:MAG: aminomethyl-transferring glycine dehydrogenase subunit GcvPA [Caldicoprobacter sp.]|uniref:aminomethyl-transferring glycine dehydrogenase subunit GcvPA n=1 Tax=Caldicoprobacter sp. TaxID=2004500 RepID=UPI001E156CCC|nr:aminomethyl-transferring glycine dehydrogenase [Clostridia bacterium]
MGRYIPNTAQDRQDMLEKLGLHSIEQLYEDIPCEVQLKNSLALPVPLSEMELVNHMRDIAAKNKTVDQYVCFLGAGAYDRYIPSVVRHVLARQEFYTSYTPYQPEISQGTLQAIFEYQTMVCELTAMDVANASMYDGASALAEAVCMACQATSREKVLVARSVHPQSKEVIGTYSRFRGIKVQEIGYADGRVDMEELKRHMDGDVAAVVVQNPNFFGVIELLDEMAEVVHHYGGLLVVSANPISLAVLKPPGHCGADIVVGEGQPLGNPLNFGGPYLGFMATTQKLMRRMPGRIVGQTVDLEGNRGFVLTLQTREQHIRREKATSNICSNEALNALAATVYLSVLGKEGLKEVALLSMRKAHYAFERLISDAGCSPVFSTPFFDEFLVKVSTPVEELNRALLSCGIIGGYAVERDYPELQGGWLVAVTEKRTREEIDALVREVSQREGKAIDI